MDNMIKTTEGLKAIVHFTELVNQYEDLKPLSKWVKDANQEIAELKEQLENMTDEAKNLTSLYDEDEETIVQLKEQRHRKNMIINSLKKQLKENKHSECSLCGVTIDDDYCSHCSSMK